MANFFVALWESIFQPGTTPQLIVATHVSFIALLGTLLWLIYATKGNVHFYVLFFIALCLWVSVIWFIQELKSVSLKSNEQLEVSAKKEKETEEPKVDPAGEKEEPRSSNVRSRSRKL